MKAVLHYTRQFAQIVVLPEHQMPPETLEGLGGMEFVRLEATADKQLTGGGEHWHYGPRRPSAPTFPNSQYPSL